MKAILLAAGLGSRLKPLTDTVPKCLTEVNDSPILINALEQLVACDMQEAIIVVGYLKEQIQTRIGSKFRGMLVSYVDNDQYRTTSTSLSLMLGLQAAPGEDVVILEGDVFFSRRLLQEFLAATTPNATVVQKYNPTLDGSFVEIQNGVVTDWIHTSQRAPDFTIEDKYKTVNIHKFEAAFVENILVPVLEEHVVAGDGKDPVEIVMQDIVRSNLKAVRAFETGNLKWFEIDDLNDLRIAEKMFMRPSIDEMRTLHGGYWRHDHLDFYYLCNQYFPTPELYRELAEKLPIIGNYYPSSQHVVAQLLAQWKEFPYFTAGNLVVGNGSSELIKILNEHVITKMTVPLPTFNEFIKLPADKIHRYVLSEEEEFILDADQLIAHIHSSGSEYAVIVNPNNPVGGLVCLNDIKKILNTGVILIVDEAFIAFAGEENSAEQLISQYNNLVVIVSCTKSHGVGGIRLAYALSSNDMIKEKLRKHLPVWNINSIAECLIEIMPKYQKEYRESIAQTIADTKWFFENLQSILYLNPYPTYSNAVICKVHGSAKKLAEILYEKYNMMVKEGLNQQEIRTDAYIRLGVRSRRDNEMLLAALREINVHDLLPFEKAKAMAMTVPY